MNCHFVVVVVVVVVVDKVLYSLRLPDCPTVFISCRSFGAFIGYFINHPLYTPPSEYQATYMYRSLVFLHEGGGGVNLLVSSALSAPALIPIPGSHK